MRRLTLTAVAAASLALLLTGCGDASQSAAGGSTPDGLHGDVSVSAAASLQGAFDEVIDEFESAHPEVHVTANYDGSSTLATQIIGGAAVDVFASANQANMDKVTGPGLAADPVIFAKNTLVVITPQGNPGNVTTLQDLADPGLKVVVCAPEVPCGAASQTLLTDQGVALTPASEEQNVTAVLTKVQNDEADAGLVYKTDAATSDQVESFTPDGADQVVNSYPIVVLKDAPNRAAAQAFVDVVTGADGQKILASFGFDTP